MRTVPPRAAFPTHQHPRVPLLRSQRQAPNAARAGWALRSRGGQQGQPPQGPEGTPMWFCCRAYRRAQKQQRCPQTRLPARHRQGGSAAAGGRAARTHYSCKRLLPLTAPSFSSLQRPRLFSRCTQNKTHPEMPPCLSARRGAARCQHTSPKPGVSGPGLFSVWGDGCWQQAG